MVINKKRSIPVGMNNVKVIVCEVYSRVVGYMRPISQFNNGKKCEAMERKYVTGVNNPKNND